jgi:uncharacterized protein (DUF2384 family)
MFENIYRKDSLNFFANHGLNYERVKEVVGLTNDDLSRVAEVAKSSVRFDERIPPVLKERLEQIANCCLLVADHFDGDAKKASLWFKTPNPMLGDISPRDMIRFGRFSKLQRFIVGALTEGGRREQEAQEA